MLITTVVLHNNISYCYLSASVHVNLVDGVLSLLLIRVDASAMYSDHSQHLTVTALWSYALLKAKISSLVEMCPSLL